MRGNQEHKMQVALMEYLALAADPRIKIFAIPNQSNRHIANAVRMKAEGVRAGTPDLCVMLMGGKVGWLELKTPKGRLSKAQLAFRDDADRLGHYWAVARSIGEALEVLTEWGALMPKFEVSTNTERRRPPHTSREAHQLDVRTAGTPPTPGVTGGESAAAKGRRV